ncbi:MAG: hypothetical protein Q4G45_12635 [Actinomycetia bacterium]|nr:hypothetical protein [Actinomycetes bacterium]
MKPLWLWLRASWWLGPLLLISLSAGLLRNGAWRWDWSWMLSAVAGSTLLACPLLAAAAVVVVLRSFPVSLQQITTVTKRGHAVLLDLALVLWVQALLAYLVVLGIGIYWCLWYEADPRGLTLPWQLLTAPAALLAAVVLGLLIGRLVRSAWTVPALAVALFLSHRVFYELPLPELVTLEMVTGSMTNAGMRPVPVHLAATVTVNLLLSLAAAALLHWMTYPPGGRPRRWLVLAGAAAGVLVVMMGWGWSGTYQPIPA